MSLYDDYKKKKSGVNNDSKSEEVNQDIADDTNNSEVSVGSEVYKIVNIPFYKKKEFYILLTGLVVVFAILFLLVYTPSFEMENLNGKTNSYATTYSETYDLSLSTKEEFSDEFDKGEIFKQSLKAGNVYKEGSVLEVVVSLGPDYDKLITYPDFSLMLEEDAKTWKNDNKAIGTEIIAEYNDSVPEGEFIKEELDSDANKNSFKRSSKVKLYYSKGKKPVADKITVPSFLNKTVEEVALWSLENDVVLTVKEEFALYLAPNTVISQSVVSGEKIDRKSTISVTIAVGEGISVPSFSNTSAEDAANLGVPIGLITNKYSKTVPKGKLISQSYAQYSVIKDTDTVDLVYSLGLVPIGDYVGMSKIAVSDELSLLNQNGANLKITYVEKSLASAPEGTVEGTVESQSIRNDFVNPGSSITITIYR